MRPIPLRSLPKKLRAKLARQRLANRTPEQKVAAKAKYQRNKQREAWANATLDLQLARLKLPLPASEIKFKKIIPESPKNWRFDRAYIAEKIGFEIEGGNFSGGRHTRGSGFGEDILKYNTAAIAGWRVIRATYAMITDGSAVVALAAAWRRSPHDDEGPT